MINVEDFGAKADGVTDDAPAFQAAINANQERKMARRTSSDFYGAVLCGGGQFLLNNRAKRREMNDFKYQRRIVVFDALGLADSSSWVDEHEDDPFYSYNIDALDHGAEEVVVTYPRKNGKAEYHYRKVRVEKTAQQLWNELLDAALHTDDLSDLAQRYKDQLKKEDTIKTTSTADTWSASMAFDAHQPW